MSDRNKQVSSPFGNDDEQDIDDATFLANAPQFGGNGNGNGNGNGASAAPSAADQRLEELHREKEAIEQRTLDSTKRSLGLLYDTERVGQATAEELAKQREQLENTNQQLDMIGATLRSSQKHINGLKSVFGGLKNYLAGNRAGTAAAAAANGAGTAAATNGDVAAAGGTPKVLSPSPSMADKSFDGHPVARLRGDGPPAQLQSRTSAYTEQLDANLDMMAGSLSRLKGMAIDLNQDIESQNELIDGINDKVENVDVKIQRQNRDLNKMLK